MAKRKPVEGIGPTPERRKHDKIDTVPSLEKGGKAHRVRNPWTIDDWLEKGKLTRDEHSVALRYATSHHRAFGSEAKISRYNPDPAHPGDGVGAMYDLRQMRALHKTLGKADTRWLLGVIVYGDSLRTLERQSSVRNGSGLEHFRAALHRVANIWRMPMGG